MNLSASRAVPMIFCMALGGCGNAVPNCDDLAIRELVADMIERHYEKMADAPLELPTAPLPGAVIAKLDNIRTVSFDPESKARQCRAGVALTGPAELNDRPEVSYRIGPSEGKDRGYTVTLQWF